MTTPRFRCQWYQDIFEKFPNIVADAERAGKALKLDKVAGRVGLYTGASSVPGPLPDYVIDAIVAANRTPILPLKRVEDELRMLIKEVYGDAYDGAVTNTCEAGLRVAYETLFAPPFMRRGDAYRSRVLTPYGEDYEWGAAYGRAFPPRYKNIAVDRSVSAGELGMEAKSLANVDTLFVRYAGVPYEVHGIRQGVVPLMLGNDIDGTMARIREASARHAANLVGFQTIGYDTPGYGNGAHDDNGAPIFLKELGAFAESCDLPFLIDSASCLPVVGYSPVDVNADVMVYSMDKPGRAPIAGLMIGKAEAMSYIRKALGLGGDRAGGVSSHGKAAQSAVDPGRDSLVGLTTFLKVLRDDPGRITRPIDQYHEIMVEAFAEMKPSRFRDKIIIGKSYHMGGLELNYQQTWDGDGYGIPIFTVEDLYANTNPIMLATEAMGIDPATIYNCNMLLTPGLGTLDADGELNAEYATLAVKALVKSVEIVYEYAGLGD